ncbi:MAG: hypothetical protein JWM98_2122 [Thermoleophilia bacterium]|nr:hypothetical protein [Thermoleophilia bacterium]
MDPTPRPDPDDEPGRHLHLPVSAPGAAVDHDRQPGVPPPSADEDYDDPQDQAGAESFPASDPPGGW